MYDFSRFHIYALICDICFPLSDLLHSVCGLVNKLCPTLVTPWTVAYQSPLSMGFSRQEYWSGLPFPSPRDFPDPRMEPTSLMSLVLTGKFFTTRATENMGVSSITQLRPARTTYFHRCGELVLSPGKKEKKTMDYCTKFA